MYNHNKQTNKNTKLHTHGAQGARTTPLLNRCNKKNVKTTLNNAILNSNNNNNNDVNSNTSNNNCYNNNNKIIITITMIIPRNAKCY